MHLLGAATALFALVTAFFYAPLLGNFVFERDGWDAVLVGDLLASGEGSAWVRGGSFLLHENLHRVLGPVGWAIRWILFGTWLPGWHALDLVHHALNGAFVLWLGMTLGLARAPAMIAGFAFLLSPIHAPVLAPIGRDYDLWVTTFTLLTVGAFVRERHRRGALWLGLALLSKETALALPAVLVVLGLARGLRGRALVGALRWYALPFLVIVLARGAQLLVKGSLDGAALPSKVLDLSVTRVLLDGPRVLGHALLAWLEPVVPVEPALLGLAGLGLLLAVAWLGRRNSVALGLLTAAALTLAPTLCVTTSSEPAELGYLLANTRYVVLPLAFLLLGIVHLVFSRTTTPWRRGLAAFALVLHGASITLAVERARHPEPTGAAVLRDLGPPAIEPPSETVIYVGREDPATSMFLLSAFAQRHYGTRFVLPWRGLGVARQRSESGPLLDFVNDPSELVPFTWRPASALVLRPIGPGASPTAVALLPVVWPVGTTLTEPESLGTPGHSTLDGSVRVDGGAFVLAARPRPGPRPPFAVWSRPRATPARLVTLELRGTARDGESFQTRLELQLSDTTAPPTSALEVLSLPVTLNGQRHEVTLDLSADPILAHRPVRTLWLAGLSVPARLEVGGATVR